MQSDESSKNLHRLDLAVTHSVARLKAQDLLSVCHRPIHSVEHRNHSFQIPTMAPEKGFKYAIRITALHFAKPALASYPIISGRAEVIDVLSMRIREGSFKIRGMIGKPK